MVKTEKEILVEEETKDKKGFENLTNDSFEKSSSLKGILSLIIGNNIKQPLSYNPLEGFTRLSEVEYTYLKKSTHFLIYQKLMTMKSLIFFIKFNIGEEVL